MVNFVVQIAPEEVVSNTSKWIKSAGFTPPDFLGPTHVDHIVRLITVVVMAVAVVWLLAPYFLRKKTEDGGELAKSTSVLLTVDDCAEVLGMKPVDVVKLLEKGDLRGLKINDEWRLLPRFIVEFLVDQTRRTQLEVFAAQLKCPDTWANELRKHPEFKAEIEAGSYAKNTVGKFLQDALLGKATDMDKPE